VTHLGRVRADGRAEHGTAERAQWKAVALPSEHGGWSLTAEPALLGLIVAFSWAGLALSAAAMLAFVARTPLKIVLVDRWRGRRLERTALAARVATGELLVMAALVVAAALGADGPFWIPFLVAAPLIGIEFWYDMRSRGRRLVPELAGTIGIGSVAAAVAIAGDESGLVAAGLWCVIGARSVAAIPYVRCQILRTRSRSAPRWQSDVAQVAAVTIAIVGWLVDAVPIAAVVALAVLGVVNLASMSLAPRKPLVIGVQQMIFGLGVIAVTAVAVLAA
jgi:hypothetical protein